MVIEYVPGGELFDYILHQDSYWTRAALRSFPVGMHTSPGEGGFFFFFNLFIFILEKNNFFQLLTNVLMMTSLRICSMSVINDGRIRTRDVRLACLRIELICKRGLHFQLR